MSFKECLEIGLACGLETVGEALSNICNHAIQVFAHDEVFAELDKLYDEFEQLGIPKETMIKDVLKEGLK